jgi:hypothetical protein
MADNEKIFADQGGSDNAGRRAIVTRMRNGIRTAIN